MFNLPVFIVGSPRSGTTLMRLLLNAHPDIAIPHETGVYTLIFNRPIYWKLLPAYFFLKRVSFYKKLNVGFKEATKHLAFFDRLSIKNIINALFENYAWSNGKKYWGEKTPMHFRFIHQIKKHYPQSTVVFMIRDPRAVVASSKRYINEKREGDDFWITGNMQEILNIWSFSVRYAIKYKHQIYLLKYETLVDEPETTLKSICRQLGVKYSNSMMEFYLNSEKQIPKNIKGELQPWHKQTTNPINKYQIDKWREELNKKEIAFIEDNCKEQMKYLGYNLIS